MTANRTKYKNKKYLKKSSTDCRPDNQQMCKHIYYIKNHRYKKHIFKEALKNCVWEVHQIVHCPCNKIVFRAEGMWEPVSCCRWICALVPLKEMTRSQLLEIIALWNLSDRHQFKCFEDLLGVIEKKRRKLTFPPLSQADLIWADFSLDEADCHLQEKQKSKC